MPISISLQNPQLISISKRSEKNSVGLPTKFITEYTIKGKLLSSGGIGSITLPTIQANLSSILPSISVTGAPITSATKLVSFSIDKSDSRDTIEKDYILIFEHHSALPSSAYTDLNLNPQDFLNILDLKVEESEEKTVTSTTKTLSISITYTDTSYTSSFGSAKSLAEKINSNVSTNSDRETLSVISDENSKTYSFIFNAIKFAKAGIESTSSISRNISISSNGAIVAIQTTKENAPAGNKASPDFSSLSYLAEPNENDLKNFVLNYFKKGGGPTNYRTDFFKINSRKTIDHVLGIRASSITITNSPEYVKSVGIINITEIKSKVKFPEGEKKIIRGSIIGIGKKGLPLKNQTPKFNSAMNELQKLLGTDLALASKKTKIDGFYMTNASFNGDITEGSVNFEVTYEKRPEFQIQTEGILYGSAGIYSSSETHLGNIFLVVGSKDKEGKEIIQESNQSKPEEFTLKMDVIVKGLNFKPAIEKFKKLVKENLGSSIIKSINITTSTRNRSFQGTASWKQYGKYRDKKDQSIKSKTKALQI